MINRAFHQRYLKRFVKTASKEEKNSFKKSTKRLNHAFNDWNLLVQDESIFIHDSIMTKRKRRWIVKNKRPIGTVTGSHSKTIVFGVLSLDSKQLFRQYERFDSHSFITYIDDVRKKFNKFIMFVDRASQHRARIVKEYLQRNLETTRVAYFPVGSPELNAVEEC